MTTGDEDNNPVGQFLLPRSVRRMVWTIVIVWTAINGTFVVMFSLQEPRVVALPSLMLVLVLAIFVRAGRVRVSMFREHIVVRNRFRTRTVMRADIISFERGQLGRPDLAAGINLVTRDRNIQLDIFGRQPISRRGRAKRDASLAILESWLSQSNLSA